MPLQLKLFFTALMFYTRIPCPKNIDHSPEFLNKATRFFSLIGIIVGLISFVVFFLTYPLFGVELAVVFSLIAGVLTTGAFHEDGLADVFDGFGGGWSKLQILTIMKDSRVGAYGVVSLVFLFLIKYLALVQITNFILASSLSTLPAFTSVAFVFINYHTLARFTAANLIFSSTYAREDETSKAKPIAKSHSYKEVVGVYLFTLIPFVLTSWFFPLFAVVLLPLFLLVFFAKRYFEKWLDGYTGDCLGCVEQLAECLVLLSIIGLWKFIG
ncbi:MAG: adenosylcobinamide-GDP ribazoletransferase [Crocinitomicaceae bacterium]|nr:adenosylcobinamide-GDP ribazoletransferase [Crocinitomicaceae bacterium]